MKEKREPPRHKERQGAQRVVTEEFLWDKKYNCFIKHNRLKTT